MKTIFRYLLLTFVCAGWGACQDFDDDTSSKPTTPELSFVESSLTAGKATGDYELTIKANLPWRIESNKDWVSFSPTYGDGDATVTVTVGANRTLDPRTAKISAYIIKGEEVTLTLTQEAASASDLAASYYVKVDGDASKDGSSWENATTLENALENAMNGDFIYVAAGTYSPTVPLTGVKTDADKTFEIHSNFTMIGGFPADAKEGAVADPEANETILDGGSKVYHVVCVTAAKMAGMKATLDGFTIKGGSSNFGSAGGPTIGGVKIYNTYGSALYIGNTTVDILRCKIVDNLDARQGAVRVDKGAEALMSYCEIKNNASRINGTTAYNGGAFWVADCTMLHIDHSTIANNKTSGVGVGVYVLGTGTTTNVLISNSTVCGNTLHAEVESRAGGGIYTREYGNVVVINSTVYGNHCGRGAGIAVHGTAAAPSKTYVINCTVTGNSDIAPNYGPGLLQNAAPATIEVYNTLITGNTEAGNDANVKLQSSNNKIAYSVVGSMVYDSEGKAIPGVLFNFASMLGTLADNGGATQSCVLLGQDNPARQWGMSTSQLQTLCAGLDPVFKDKLLCEIDQLGDSREGKTTIGAVVK